LISIGQDVDDVVSPSVDEVNSVVRCVDIATWQKLVTSALETRGPQQRPNSSPPKAPFKTSA